MQADEVKKVCQQHEEQQESRRASAQGPRKTFLDPGYTSATQEMSLEAACSASEFLKEVALGMQVLANERSFLKAEPKALHRPGIPASHGNKDLGKEDAGSGLNMEETLAKHCLSGKELFFI